MYRVELYSRTTNDYVWRMCELRIIIMIKQLCWYFCLSLIDRSLRRTSQSVAMVSSSSF